MVIVALSGDYALSGKMSNLIWCRVYVEGWWVFGAVSDGESKLARLSGPCWGVGCVDVICWRGWLIIGANWWCDSGVVVTPWNICSWTGWLVIHPVPVKFFCWKALCGFVLEGDKTLKPEQKQLSQIKNCKKKCNMAKFLRKVNNRSQVSAPKITKM